MEIVRGALVLAAGPGDYAGKPRPFVVVQSDTFNETHSSITLCPMTSVLGGERLFRVPVSPTDDNGLRVASEVQVDKMQSMRRERLERVIGHLSTTRMEQVDQALRRWLAL